MFALPALGKKGIERLSGMWLPVRGVEGVGEILADGPALEVRV